MTATRLSPLDASFLEVETPTAHMHVGWAAVLEPPPGRPPGFEDLREHIRARLGLAPRYRQLLRPVPFGLNAPVWVDDPDFDLTRHVLPSDATTLGAAIERCMSEPLPRERPLWQMQIAPRLADGTIALVGKAHHCMVDGLAAVQLGSLLLDPDPDPPAPAPDDWSPAPPPGSVELLVAGAADLLRAQLRIGRLPARLLGSPAGGVRLLRRGARALEALADSARPARAVRSLNPPISPRRHLGRLERPLDELIEIKRALGVTLNDVVLAVSTTGVRRFMAGRGERPVHVKAMVPVSVRGATDEDELGNRISFMFVDLPCGEPDPRRRLREINAETERRKRRGTPQGGDEVLGLLGAAPAPVQRLLSRLVASPRTFNLVVSNIPGPPGDAYMRGCRLRAAYPVVPIADRHALSIGFTSVAGSGCFGLYADRETLPDVDVLADLIDGAIDELGELAAGEGRPAARPVPVPG